MAEITVHLSWEQGAADAAFAEPRSGDEIEYRRGRQAGMEWARHASPAEVDEIVSLADRGWLRFRVRLTENSMPRAYARARHLPDPAAGGHYWFRRSWFTLGMVEGAAAAARTRMLLD